MTAECPHAAGTNGRRVGADRSITVLRAGYPFLLGLRRDAGADTVDLRLLGRRTTVLAGPDGARLFYDESVMRRRGAMPRPLRRTLFGDGAIHGLDDSDHKHRKGLFLDVLTPAAATAIAAEAAHRWAEQAGDPVEPAAIFHDAVTVHAAAVLEWAGVLASETYAGLDRDLIAMVDGFGSVGLRHVRARRARKRTDAWAKTLIRDVRSGRVQVPGTALAAIAEYRGRDGELLPPKVAGVELLNVLRPTVAVAYFVAFTAHALTEQPGLRDKLRGADDALLESFAHEVRRHYPFVPMLAAKVRRAVTFHGHRLRRGRRVILDVYGMLHDPQWWSDPGSFDTERFLGSDPDPFTFVPQGGGDPATGHRCPGERVAIELIKTAVRHLVEDRPAAQTLQDFPLNRFPTRPLARSRPVART